MSNGFRSKVLMVALSVAGVACSGGGGSTTSDATATPVFSPDAGTYAAAQSVTISTTTTGATIHYTTDGSTPTPSSPTYGGAVTVGADMTLKAIATAAGYSSSAVGTADYLIRPPAATPTFSPDAGTYNAAQSVTLSCATAGATIYYTTDGSAPTTSSSVYGAPIAVGATTTIRAIATAALHSQSGEGTAVYTIHLPAATPTFSPVAGAYDAAQSVTISTTTPAATIYYTTDNTEPSILSDVYAAPIAVGHNMTLKAIAVSANTSLSAVGTAAYTITPPAAAPTFTPAGGDYRGVQVTLATTSAGASIYYTMDGSTPSATSTPYTGPIAIADGSPDVTIRAIAIGNGWSASPIRSETYTSHDLGSYAFATTSRCLPDGSAVGANGEPIHVRRASTATYLDEAGALHTCAANEARIGCDAGYSGRCGLLVEPAATQLHPSPTAPATGSATLPSLGYYQFWVEGDATASQVVSPSGSLVGTNLPCTASPGSPCQFQVTSLGDGLVTLSAVQGTGALTRAQLERGEYRTSFIPVAGQVRAADVVWLDNPMAGTENLVVWSDAPVDSGYWTFYGGSPLLTATGGLPDGVGGNTAVHIVSSSAGGVASQANIAVTPSTQYTWSFDARNNGGTAAALSVYCDTSESDIVPVTAYIGQLNSAGWVRVSQTFTTPANCDYINVYFLRDSGVATPGGSVDLYVARPQLEVGPRFTSYSATRGYRIASDVSGGTWCIQGTWTPEKGAPWSSAVRETHYRVISTFENDTRNAFFLSFAWSGVLTWDVWGSDNVSRRLVPPFSPFDAGTTHTIAGSNANGTIRLYEDGASVGALDGGLDVGGTPGTGVFDAQKKKLGLTPLAGDSASEPFGGFLRNLTITRTLCQ
jgi:hypothetical protein